MRSSFDIVWIVQNKRFKQDDEYSELKDTKAGVYIFSLALAHETAMLVVDPNTEIHLPTIFEKLVTKSTADHVTIEV